MSRGEFQLRMGLTQLWCNVDGATFTVYVFRSSHPEIAVAEILFLFGIHCPVQPRSPTRLDLRACERVFWWHVVYSGCMSRTNIDIDDEACGEVMRRYQLATKRDAVNLALRTLAAEPLTVDDARLLRGCCLSL